MSREIKFTNQEHGWLIDGINDLQAAIQAFDDEMVTQEPSDTVDHLRDTANGLLGFLRRKTMETPRESVERRAINAAGMAVHHINGDRNDNRLENLTLVRKDGVSA